MSKGAHSRTRGRRSFGPRRQRATLATWRGYFWALVIATDFYLLSNPLVFEPFFDISLQRAVLVTAVAVVVSVPWLRVPSISPVLAVFMLWGLASVVWSIQRLPTIAAFDLYMTLAALAVMTYANVNGAVLALGFVWGGLLVSGLSVYSFHERMPGSYFETLSGDVFSGVGTNPNILSYSVTLALAGWLALWPRSALSTILWLLAGSGLIWVVYASGSTSGYLTAASTVVAALALLVVARLGVGAWSGRRRALWSVGIGATTVAGAVALTLTGHGPGTFSDRLPFWEGALSVVAANRPVVGYGWGAVWAHPWLLAPENEVVDQIYRNAGVALTHGHNSFVDLAVDLGAVGVVLMMAVVVSVLWVTNLRPSRAQSLAGTDDAVRSRFVVLCVVDLLVFGITEPMLVLPLGFWALVLLTEPGVAGVIDTARWLRHAASRRRQHFKLNDSDR